MANHDVVLFRPDIGNTASQPGESAMEIGADFDEGWQQRSEQGKRAVAARWERSGKLDAKRDVYRRWQAWQQDPAQYATVAAFARAMLELHEPLEFTGTVMRWCAAWRQGKDRPL